VSNRQGAPPQNTKCLVDVGGVQKTDYRPKSFALRLPAFAKSRDTRLKTIEKKIRQNHPVTACLGLKDAFHKIAVRPSSMDMRLVSAL